jgi:hypothetical protein
MRRRLVLALVKNFAAMSVLRRSDKKTGEAQNFVTQ